MRGLRPYAWAPDAAWPGCLELPPALVPATRLSNRLTPPQFGKYLVEKSRPEWAGEYVDYRLLKDLIKKSADEYEAVRARARRGCRLVARAGGADPAVTATGNGDGRRMQLGPRPGMLGPSPPLQTPSGTPRHAGCAELAAQLLATDDFFDGAKGPEHARLLGGGVFQVPGQ